MKPVSRRDLAVLAVGVAVVAWLVVRQSYGSLPTLHWWQPVPLGLLAAAEGLGARTLRARLAAERDRRPAPGRSGAAAARPVEPMLVARLAVLAQASAWVGAGFAGLWAGTGVHALSESGRLAAAGGDAVAAAIGVVLSAALVGAALVLEHACRVPEQPDDRDDAPRG
ncbi:DUF3180 domain-containing protein [Modestobacter sp. Leaf380]|uniref:DUF3180 domain-containing protein n=1 Tax=Modestobacter sp. Leaf380 TaxID=1736356 RepID=UPI0006F9E561|nr:DUF3180 domain-containing protein [Modestobacter sp. Leaf380]KQS68603.1 hypothetical protein ASG41_06590 [Modestobacter sp. Leaf380]